MKANQQAKKTSEEFFKIEEAREAAILNETYRMLRFYIKEDGTVENYAINNHKPGLRYERILYLDEEITKHPKEKQDYINEILSRDISAHIPDRKLITGPRSKRSLFE